MGGEKYNVTLKERKKRGFVSFQHFTREKRKRMYFYMSIAER
jgi:hypothetical protein